MKFAFKIKSFFLPILLTSFFFHLTDNRINAGPFGDDMARCLVLATSSKDNSLLGRWLVRVYGEHSDSKDLTKLSDYKKELIDKDVAELFTRLLSEDCREETKKALKFEGDVVMFNAFRVLGEVAGQELIEDKNVSKAINKFTEYVDYRKLKYLE
tara:strand:- start:122 stop:586 length:465 start_codon:yes stop_codon:yes gene_type:complete